MPDRPLAPYAQIAAHYRTAIADGALRPGERLPSVLAIAQDWHVASATAARAISLLQIEGVIYTSPRGTFVSTDELNVLTPGDRIKVPSVRRAPPTAEDVIEVAEVGVVAAPDYVASILGLEPGANIVRREEITSRGGRRRMLAVDWIPANGWHDGAELLSPEPLRGGPEHVIRTLTQRHVTTARDSLRARGADAREAAALRIPIGTPILAGVHIWCDDAGVILYGEWVMPPDQVVSYAYDVAEDDATASGHEET
jgi:GntR family transcriptional regulator